MIYFIENLCNMAGRSQSHLTIQLRHLAHELHMSAQHLGSFQKCYESSFLQNDKASSKHYNSVIWEYVLLFHKDLKQKGLSREILAL